VNTDRGDIYVTTNLFMTLRRLRDCSLDRIVWIDAICIDQENTKERKSKVALMAIIYANASGVVVWLEEAMAASDNSESGDFITDGGPALKVSHTAANHLGRIQSPSETDKQAVFTLLQRSWFKRIWVRPPSVTYLVTSSTMNDH